MRSYIVKKNHIGSVVSEIQTDTEILLLPKYYKYKPKYSLTEQFHMLDAQTDKENYCRVA